MKKKWYLFSFSLNRQNQGACCVEGVDWKDAVRRLKVLDIAPKSDNIQSFSLMGSEPGFELDRLYSKAEMVAMDYKLEKSKI